MVRRMLRALTRRATDGDLFAVEALANLRGAVDVALRQGIAGAHDGPAHYSWGEIGQELGMSRQAARMYGLEGGSKDGG